MATPVVAGSAALVRQYFMDGYYPSGKRNEADKRTPSGALIKAVMISGGPPGDHLGELHGEQGLGAVGWCSLGEAGLVGGTHGSECLIAARCKTSLAGRNTLRGEDACGS